MRAVLRLLLAAGLLSVAWGLVGHLGEACHPSGRCSVQLSRCVESVCRCGDSARPNARNNRCLPEVTGLHRYCEEDVQCLVEHSTCRRKSKECDCRKGYIVSRDKTSCLPESQLCEPCQETAQCRGSTECSAEHRVCVCQGMSYEFNGACVTDHSSKEWELIVVTALPSAASQTLYAGWLLLAMLVALLAHTRGR